MIGWFCSLAVIGSLLPGCDPSVRIYGYVEGEYVAMAPLESARIAAIEVGRGDRVEAGAVLARMATDDAEIAAANAAAALAQAESDLADQRRGRRPEEIDVVAATLASARAQQVDAERALERRHDLFQRKVASQADLDQAQTARDVAAAKVRELEANLEVARLPAREDQLKAAEARVEQAKAALSNARWRLAERALKTTSAGRIADLIRRPGEVAGPQAPVVSFLPDGAVKLKLWAPETAFSRIALGGSLAVACDGCEKGLTARVTYVSPEPEFTPPVIYSVETRAKLVHLIEARPEGPAREKLRPGQLVDVTLPGGGS
ncbi:MAG: HlyD family efflux transporter periplasmic adaptor subunit [Hyphomicrobiales bacterium]|nr:HlyD family efflux transporter periplasmic adaptor subunit [Hyphomicrobiales bacterium]